MKISILSYYSGSVNRGVETLVEQLSQRFIKSGHQVDIYNSRNLFSPSALPAKLDPKTNILWPTNGRLQSIQSKIWTITHHKKVIISGQSGIGFDDRLNLYTFPDIFVGLTDFQCAWAKKINPMVRVIKIPNGVDTKTFRPNSDPATINLPKPIVLNVGAFTKIKRQDILIKAVSRTNMSLLLVGSSGSEESLLQSMGNKLLPGRFKMLSLPHTQLPGIYTACDIFAYPCAPYESFGIAILEAMASGLPVVATDDPIRREIIGEEGIFVQPENIDQFSLKLNQSLDTFNHKKTVSWSHKFDWDRIADRYLNLFSTIL